MIFAIYCVCVILNVFLAKFLVGILGISNVILFQTLSVSANVMIYETIIWLLFSLVATCIYEFITIKDYKFCAEANGYLSASRLKLINKYHIYDLESDGSTIEIIECEKNEP